MSFLGFFRRRPDAGRDPAGALDPEGWQVGDQAECLAKGWWLHAITPATGPAMGEVRRVTAVKVSQPLGLPVPPILFLAISGHDGWFVASAFRKLRPRADEATPAEAEFTELVKRKPTPAPLPDQPKIEEFQ